MGYRAHVFTTYQVRYGSGFFSANACDAVNRLLVSYEYLDGGGYRKNLVEYCDQEESVIELNRKGLESLVESLGKKFFNPKELDALSGIGYSRENLADVFKRWLKSADKSNNFIRIEWF